MNAPWGALLEAELAGVDVVRAHVISHGPAEVPVSWVRGRQAPAVVFSSRTQASAAVDAAWSAGRTFVLREVPALRLDTTVGGLLVIDIWGDSGFRPLATRAGAGVLRLDSPLVAVLDAVELMRLSAGPDAQIVALPIGWHRTESITRRHELTAWMAMPPRDANGADGPWAWQPEPEGGIGDGPWAAQRAFGQVNSREEILRAAVLVEKAASAAIARRPESSAVSTSGGIDDIEDYLRGMVRQGD